MKAEKAALIGAMLAMLAMLAMPLRSQNKGPAGQLFKMDFNPARRLLEYKIRMENSFDNAFALQYLEDRLKGTKTVHAGARTEFDLSVGTGEASVYGTSAGEEGGLGMSLDTVIAERWLLKGTYEAFGKDLANKVLHARFGIQGKNKSFALGFSNYANQKASWHLFSENMLWNWFYASLRADVSGKQLDYLFATLGHAGQDNDFFGFRLTASALPQLNSGSANLIVTMGPRLMGKDSFYGPTDYYFDDVQVRQIVHQAGSITSEKGSSVFFLGYNVAPVDLKNPGGKLLKEYMFAFYQNIPVRFFAMDNLVIGAGASRKLYTGKGENGAFYEAGLKNQMISVISGLYYDRQNKTYFGIRIDFSAGVLLRLDQN